MQKGKIISIINCVLSTSQDHYSMQKTDQDKFVDSNYQCSERLGNIKPRTTAYHDSSLAFSIQKMVI